MHDDEFTPEGPKKWNSAKYFKKLGNIERVLFDVAAADKNYPAVIGVSEVETRARCWRTLWRRPNWPPATTVSCITIRPKPAASMWPFALIVDVFKLEGSFPVKTVVPQLPNFKTRDI